MNRKGENQPLVNDGRRRTTGGPSGLGLQDSLYTKKIGKVGYTFVGLLVLQLVSKSNQIEKK